jgi:regulator of replication initiation timing
MTKKLRNILIALAAVAILLAILFNEFLIYSAIFVGAMIVFYALYSAFLGTKDREIETLKNRLQEEDALLVKVRSENDELRSRKLNLSAIRQILDVGLFEVDTNFTRTWNEEITTDDGKVVQFIGALRVDLIAKYGVDLTDLRVKYENDEVLIANMELKSLSFTDLDYDWTIAEVLEHKKPYVGDSHRRTNVMLELEANKIKDRLRKRTHEEVKNGPEEMNAVINILKKQLSHSISMVLGLQDKKVRFVDEAGDGFKKIEAVGAMGSG